MAAGCDAISTKQQEQQPWDVKSSASVSSLDTNNSNFTNPSYNNIHDLVELITRPDQIQPAHLQSVLESLCTLSAASDSANRCIAAGAVPAVLSLLTTPNDTENKNAILYSDLKCQHLLLQLLLRLLLAGAQATDTPAPALVVASLSKRLLRLSDTTTSLCLSVLLVLCGGASGANSASHVRVFRSALVDQMPVVSGKLVLVMQVSNDASAKRKAAALLRLASAD